MRKTFDRLTWEAVKDGREHTIVVDNHHAYAKIKDRLDSLWEHIRLIQPEDDQLMILGGLVALAAEAQLAAENLSLVDEQFGVDETHDTIERECEEAKKNLADLIAHIDRNKTPIKSVQRGTNRFSFEFNEEFLDVWRAITNREPE